MFIQVWALYFNYEQWHNHWKGCEWQLKGPKILTNLRAPESKIKP